MKQILSHTTADPDDAKFISGISGHTPTDWNAGVPACNAAASGASTAGPVDHCCNVVNGMERHVFQA